MVCPKCGTPVEPGDKFCEVCGTPLQSAEAAAPTPTPAPQPSPAPQPNPAPQGPMLNTRRIRKWFQVKISKWPLLISLIGIFLFVWGSAEEEIALYRYGHSGKVQLFFGAVFVVGGIVLFFYLIYAKNSVGLAEVDAATNYQLGILSGRALEKLDLIDEQANLIDPVVTYGYGASPDDTFRASKAASAQRRGLLRRFFGLFGALFSYFFKDGTELDPYEAYRIAEDNVIRSMLLQVSTFRFTETQVLVYTANVDISTGLIYSEETAEVFYEDIEGIEFAQEAFKVYNSNIRKFVNKKRENIKLYLAGCNLSASIIMNENDSYIDSHRQFAAMRNLIREKKA